MGKQLRISVQLDTEVVASRNGLELFQGTPGEQVVSQAYCAAVSVSYSGADAQSWAEFASLILEAAYEATLYVAVENALRHPSWSSSRKVFLTSLGGGSFGNNIEWIKASVFRALDKFRDVGIEVYMVSFAQPTLQFAELA